ncbi:SDR family NAD(P)-dependent oxidoreductase [Paenibacillus senegalimassiliensis]|uniref:SDR family NAD(P)-dependent oxidoreductase n=1 Tax=Paenibacillus senegalimassiliensis TaxID=1737426 RepID=UPI000B192A0D|nr:SDR family NAD(P)-dependent oxidoreductase [Paenibacillus senegalimassiliensis]
MQLSMKTIVITGGNTGLGYECAKTLAQTEKNAHIVLACRNTKKGEEAAFAMKKETGHTNITAMELDLSSLESVRTFAKKFSTSPLPPLYALVCNAGVQFVDKAHVSKDGFEETFAVNHLGHFLLINLLVDKMVDHGRIVFVSSGTHDPLKKSGMPEPVYEDAMLLAYSSKEVAAKDVSFTGRRLYTTSKLCNIYCTYELADRINLLTNKQITVNAFDPGLMPETGLARSWSPFLRFVSRYILGMLILVHPQVNTTAKSGRRLAALVTSPQFEDSTGKYYEGVKEIPSSVMSYNLVNRKNLWNVSVELTKLKASESILLTD